MISKAFTRSLMVAALACGMAGVPAAATAALAAGGTETTVVQRQQLVCDLVKQAASTLPSGLPTDQVVSQVFTILNGLVPTSEIRSCLGL